MSFVPPRYNAMKLLAGFQHQFLDQFYGFQPDSANSDTMPLAFSYDLQTTLVKALAELYACCHSLSGNACFEDLTDQYIRRFPPAIQRLERYGDQMGRFVARFVPISHLTQLPAMARLEWAIYQACTAEPSEPFDYDGFSEARWRCPDNIHLQLAPGLALLEADYAVDLLWQQYQQLPGSQSLKYLDHGAVRLVVVLHEGRLQIERLSTESWQFLLQLNGDGRLKTLEQALSGCWADQLDWALQRGWIGGFSLKPQLAGAVGECAT